MDLGDRRHAVCVLNKAGDPTEERTVVNDREAVGEWISRYKGAKVAMGTGTHSSWISGFLEEMSVTVGHGIRIVPSLWRLVCSSNAGILYAGSRSIFSRKLWRQFRFAAKPPVGLALEEGFDKFKQYAAICYMSTVIRISSDLAQEAKTRSSVEKRSLTSQVEYWARIGRIAEDNPELPFSFIKEILIAREEARSAKEEYVFG